MVFSITELKVVSELGKGNREVSEIAKALKISPSQSYRIAQKLCQKGISSLSEGAIQPEMKTHVNLFLKLLSKAANLSSPLSGTGLQIYLTLLEPKTTKEIEKETGLHRTTVLKKIKQGRKMSLLLIENKKYRLNEKIWPDAKEYFIELKKYEDSIDQRIPVNSVIYFKNTEEIVFSNKENIDAEKTAFSAYSKFGIELLLITNYYYLPKKQLAKKEVFMHSLMVAEKGNDARDLIFVALFLAKYKKELSKVKHQIVKNLNKVFLGENIPGYPSLAEIKDRARIYNIKV
ncbi:MAG: hypothetical protein AABX32_02280 [Nanoarchaeota archaeon]